AFLAIKAAASTELSPTAPITQAAIPDNQLSTYTDPAKTHQTAEPAPRPDCATGCPPAAGLTALQTSPLNLTTLPPEAFGDHSAVVVKLEMD
ncbi:MAG: hypothetical protein AAFO75_09620, partial [Pseudomonadota bacterium]